MKIIKETPQKLLGRIRIKLELSHTGKTTPSNQEIKESIAKIKKVDEETIAVHHIYTKYGEGNSKIYANLYESKEALDKTEPKIAKKEAKTA